MRGPRVFAGLMLIRFNHAAAIRSFREARRLAPTARCAGVALALASALHQCGHGRLNQREGLAELAASKLSAPPPLPKRARV